MPTYTIYRRTERDPRLVTRGTTERAPRRLGLHEEALTYELLRAADFSDAAIQKSKRPREAIIADIGPNHDGSAWIITLFDKVGF